MEGFDWELRKNGKQTIKPKKNENNIDKLT